MMGTISCVSFSLAVGSLDARFPKRRGGGSEPYIYYILFAATVIVMVYVIVMFRRYGWRPNREPDALRLEEDTVI